AEGHRDRRGQGRALRAERLRPAPGDPVHPGLPMIVSVIVAASANEVIGDGGTLPWHLPGDLRRFRALTTGHVVVMGRLTYQSILDRLGHPPTGRTSILGSRPLRDPGDPGEVLVAASVPAALALAERLAAEAGDEEFFVIGGESVYRDALPLADRVYLTRVHGEVPGDRAMPDGWLAGFEVAARDDDAGAQGPLRYSFLDYRRAARGACSASRTAVRRSRRAE